jgi:hypothetical protein
MAASCTLFLFASAMSYKVKLTFSEKAAYAIAILIFLGSLALAFWKLSAK